MAGIAADAAPAPRAFTLRPRVLRTLLWLRWQLLLRGYSRSASRIVGAVVLAIILIPSAIGLTIGLVENYGASVWGSQWKDVISFTILVLILLFRPNGILGESLGRARA